MPRRSLSVLLALTCSIHAPALASGAMPVSVDDRADAAFGEGKFLRAAELLAGALATLPEENVGTRGQRNIWATGSVNAYNEAFKADPTQCTAVVAGLEIADKYLHTLIAVYGGAVTSADEYTGMQRLRDGLNAEGAKLRCPAPVVAANDPVEPGPVEPEPASEPAFQLKPPITAPIEPRAPRKSDTRGLAAGVFVSASLAVGMTVGSVVTYTQLRGPDGKYYAAIRTASAGYFVYEAWGGPTDMCVVGKENPAVVSACRDWTAGKRLYYATTALAAVFAVSTAVFTGLLIHKRRKPGPTAALLRRHGAQLGVAPQRGGGAALTADFRF